MGNTEYEAIYYLYESIEQIASATPHPLGVGQASSFSHPAIKYI